MIEAAEMRLRLSPQVTGVVLPLAVSVFRFSTPIWLIVASFFVARLYNIALSPTQIVTIGSLSVLMSIGGIGLPSGASFFAPITPVFLSVGLPLEAIAILFAVDTIPEHGGNGEQCDGRHDGHYHRKSPCGPTERMSEHPSS